MATIVRHKTTDNYYILLGIGYGLAKTARPGMVLGDMFPSEKTDAVPTVCVCDGDGQIRWCDPGELEVIEVDGKPPGAHLEPPVF